MECGYDLLNLIPDSNTDLMVIYKAAIFDIVEVLNKVWQDTLCETQQDE